MDTVLRDAIANTYLRRLSREPRQVKHILSMLARMYNAEGKPDARSMAKYANSEHYRKLRAKHILPGVFCVGCGTPPPAAFVSRLCLHHHSYRTLHCEGIGDFCVLCASCHAILHANVRWGNRDIRSWVIDEIRVVALN